MSQWASLEAIITHTDNTKLLLHQTKISLSMFVFPVTPYMHSNSVTLGQLTNGCNCAPSLGQPCVLPHGVRCHLSRAVKQTVLVDAGGGARSSGGRRRRRGSLTLAALVLTRSGRDPWHSSLQVGLLKNGGLFKQLFSGMEWSPCIENNDHGMSF